MRPRVLIALFLFLILMGILGFAPIHLHEQVDDKILHFTIFFILACFLYFLWNLSVKRNLILATTLLLILAIGSEFIQGLLPVCAAIYKYKKKGRQTINHFYSIVALISTILLLI